MPKATVCLGDVNEAALAAARANARASEAANVEIAYFGLLPDFVGRGLGGRLLTAAQIQELVASYVAGQIPDYQMSAFLMSVFYSGMTDREVSSLTETMISSGETLDLSSLPGLKVDKHSTGGIGDKTSIILLPLCVLEGLSVPMMAGRGLGHTGGTYDKMESIPGYADAPTMAAPTACRRRGRRSPSCSRSSRPTPRRMRRAPRARSCKSAPPPSGNRSPCNRRSRPPSPACPPRQPCPAHAWHALPIA